MKRIRYAIGRWLLLPWLRAEHTHYAESAGVLITPEKLYHALSCRDLLAQFIDGRARRRWK